MMFSLRIVNVDSYQSAPIKGYDICYSEFRGCEIYKVPIIRIFGITPAGQKGCLHVHGVFPYFSIRCKDVFPNIEAKSLRKCMQELALDIDKALNVASRNSNSHRHHVYKIVVTEHIPFYGYHEKAEEFLKIYFYNPFDVSRTAELMTNGVILNKFIQPYEAHIPYILQFFIDYNLFGMNLIHVSKYKFRASEDDLVSAASPLRNQTLFHVLDESSSSSNKIWRIGALSNSQIGSLPRQTVCELEADCCSSEIMNRLSESSSSGKNPGLLAIWEEERQRRKAENDSSHITPVPSQERADFIETESENFYKKKLRKILESFDVYKVCQKDKTDHMSKGSEESSPSISDLSSTQDEEMLNLMLSLVNSHSTQLDDDSILGCNHENDIQGENVDDETLEMSQLFTGELEEMWSSQVLNSDPDRCKTSSNLDSTLMEQSEASSEDVTIPQLDGAFDEDVDMDHKPSKKSKEKTAAVMTEEALIKCCTLYQPVVRLSPTIFIKTESRPGNDISSDFVDDKSPVLTPKSPPLPICVPISKNAHCSLIMNIYENSNDVSIEHTCSSRNFAQDDTLADAEDPSNIVFEIITNLIYKVERLTEGKTSCYEHLTEEYYGESCSSALLQSLSPHEKDILRQLRATPSSLKEKSKWNKILVKRSHVEPHLSLPIKKRIFSDSWNRDEFNQCDSCSHSLSLDLSKIGKEIVLVKKLSESDFLNHIKFNQLKVVIPPLPLDLQVSNKLTPSLTNEASSSKPASPMHKKDSKFLSKKTFKLENKICDSKENPLVPETKFGHDSKSPCTSGQTFSKSSPKTNDPIDSNEKPTGALFLSLDCVNSESSQSSDSKMMHDADSRICADTDSKDPNLRISQNDSNSNSKISVDYSVLGNTPDEENSQECKINSQIPVIPDNFEPEIIPDSLDFLFSPENMDSSDNEEKRDSEVIADNSNSEIIDDNSNSVNNSDSEMVVDKSYSVNNSDSEMVAYNSNSANNSDSEMVADNSNYVNNSDSEMVADNSNYVNNSDSEMIADNSDSEMVVVNSDSEIVVDNSNSERVYDNSNSERVADNSNSERVADNSNSERVADNSNSERVADNSNSEKVADNSNLEKVADNSNSEMVANNSNSEMVADNSNSEVIGDNSNSEMVADNSNSEVAGDNLNSEVVDDNLNSKVVDNNLNSEMVADNSNSEMIADNSNSEISFENSQTASDAICSENEEQNVTPSNYSSAEEKNDLINTDEGASNKISAERVLPSNNGNKIDNALNAVSDKSNNSSAVEGKTTIFLSELRLYRRKKASLMNQRHSPAMNSDLGNESDDHHFSNSEENTASVGSQKKNSCDLEIEYMGATDKSKAQNFGAGIPVVQLEPCKDLIEKYCKNETDTDCLILKEVSHEQKTPPTVKEKRFFRSRAHQSKNLNLSPNMTLNHKLGISGPKYTTNTFLPPNRGRRNSLSNFSVRKTTRPVLRRRSVNFDTPDKKKLQSSSDFSNSSFTCEKNSIEQVYDFESPLNSAENDLDNSFFSRYSLKNKACNNNLRRNISSKLSLKFNRRRNKEEDYIPKHVTIDADSQKIIRPKRTLSVVSYNEEEDQPIEENQLVMKRFRKNNPKDMRNLPEIENSAPNDVYSVEDSDENSDWSIDGDLDPVLQFRSREALKCIISKKKINFYASHKNEKLPIPKFKVRKKKKSNPLNVNIKLVKKLSYLDNGDPDFKKVDSYYCIAPKKKKHSKKSKKKSRTFESALDVKQKYKKHKEARNEGLKNAILQYCNSMTKSKSCKLSTSVSSSEQESFQSKKINDSSPSLVAHCNLSTPENDRLNTPNSSMTEDNSEENRPKNSLKMKLKLKRITTRSNEERIVVVDKELEGIDSESDDENKSISAENTSITKPEIDAETCEKQKHNSKKLGTKIIKCDVNDLKLKAKFKCPLLIESKVPEKSLPYIEESIVKENYKNKIPKFKYKPLLANISKDLISANDNNTKINLLVKEASPEKVLIVSPKKKSPLKNAESIKKELAQLNEMTYEIKTNSSEISVTDNQNQKKVHIEVSSAQKDDSILLPTHCKLRKRRSSSNSKVSSHRNRDCPDLKMDFDNNDDDIVEEVSHCDNQENFDSASSDTSVNCKPCVIDLQKMSSLEIEKYIHKPVMSIRKSETVCEPAVASFPSPIVESKSADSYIDPKRIFENLFTFSSPSHSPSPLPFNTFEASSIMIENDMSCGPFSNDSSEHSRKEIPKTNLHAQNPLKPNDVFKSVERDDMGVLWNLAYFSPPQIKPQEKTAAFNVSLDKNTKSSYNQKGNFSFVNLQKLVKQSNETCSLSCNLMESESENSVMALNVKSVESNCKDGVNNKESKISFENILDKNINKVLDDLESIPSFSQTPTDFEVEQVMSCKSEASCESDLKLSTIIKEEPKSDPVFKPGDSVPNAEESLPNAEESLPNVRILDFQECLVESDSEMNPLLNDSEIDSVISSADMILSNGMDSQSYEQCLQTNLATDSQKSNIENRLKVISEVPKNFEIDDAFIKTDVNSSIQKQLNADLTSNNAIITAADTSSVLIPSYKTNTIPVLAINNPCQEATVNFATFDEQNLNADGQFLPVMLASVAVAENANYVDDSAIVIKENEPDPQECVNFLEDNELLQSCSVSSTSDIENKNIQTSNALGIPFNGEEDILSMIVKSCDIGEEFDGNMNSVEEMEGESISSATLCNNLIDSNYVMPGSNFIISSQPEQNSLQTNSENAVTSSSENNLITKNSEIVVIKTEPPDIPEVEQVVYELQDKNLNLNLPSKNIKIPEELVPDNVLLDTMIHSFYGDSSLYGIHSSGNNDSISLLCPTFQNTSFSQDTEAVASACNSVSLRSSMMRTADNAVETYKSDGYFKNISILQNDSFQHKSVLSNDKISSGIFKNSCYVAPSFPKVSSKRFHFVPSIKPPTREFIENSLIKKEIVEDVKVKTAVDDSLSSNSSPSSQTSCDDTITNMFKKSTADEKEYSGTQNPRSSVKSVIHHDVKASISSPVLYQDRNKSVFSFNHHLSSTPSTSNTKKEFTLPDAVVSPINKEPGLIADTSKRKRKLIFEDDSDGPLKMFKSSREKMCDLYNKYARSGSLNISADSLGNFSYSQIEGPTLENSRGFKVNSDNYGDAQVKHEVQHLTVMSLEIHANTRNDLKPNPKFDAVTAIFYCIYNDVGINNEEEVVGMIVVDPVSHHQTPGQSSSETLKNYLLLCPGVKNGYIYCVENEITLFEKLVQIIREWDPDILTGYEIQMSSWGYLIERAEVLSINLRLLLSRLIDKNEGKLIPVEQDPLVTDQTADLSRLNITGRIVLCVWRLMRKEVTLNVYSFENVYYHVLHKRTPLYAFQDLTSWFLGSQKEKVIRYYVIRVQGCIQFLEKLDIINRTSELARLFGIQFYEVLSRGSQFRVESMMLRTAAPMSYIPVSPSVRQRSHSRAPECVPLILEPESRFYIDPVVVLDFQSLYPSMIIAYNYCFSTCLGRVEHFGKNVPFEFGCSSLSVPITLLQKLQNDIHVSPTGIAFVKSSVRRGVLPSMLEEILNTRIMVKQSMKKIKDNNVLKKLLDARQLGLKLIANVTYGYTGASFSGRMPSVEVADSIVGKARETLERAIHMVENTSKWRAKVIYGDTDSLFILLPGRTKKQAFEIGQEIADAVTADNPKPVKLKFEKVYLPCVLQTKKRYVGFMYETVDQDSPVFDAKGIETVRRDSCPATAKILEKSLKILFKSYDVSLVKNYVQKQFTKLLNGHANIIDCIFAKEYRGLSGYRPGACVPALEIAKKRLSKDPRSEPRAGERVPYVVVYGFPGLPIIQLVREPIELLRDPNLRINATYYITRVISPPLERVFNLLGADVKLWYKNLARTFKPTLPMSHAANPHKGTLSQYFVTLSCPSCEKPTFTAICDDCREDLQGTTIALNEKIRQWERTVDHLTQICGSCTKSSSSTDSCISLDCPMLFKLSAAKKDLSQAPYLRKVLANELF